MRRIALSSLSVLLLMAIPVATANGTDYKGQIPQPIVHQRGSYQDIEIRTELSDYIFSTENGELRSVFLHFAPYGLRKLELIADTTTDPSTLARNYAQGGTFPFEMELPGLEGPWDYRLLEQAADRVRVEFTKVIGDLKIQKIFTIRNDPSYTVDLELILSNGGAEQIPIEDFKLLLGTDQFRLSPGEFVEGDVRYLFDGRRTEAVPPSYEYFEGLGAVTKAAVLFLKNRSPGWAPSISLDERGRKILGASSGSLKLYPGEDRGFNFTLYAGRPKWALLQQSGIERILDVGAFSQALIAVVKFLDWLYAITGNYGWVIILFTIAVRIILFLLMRKQYYSIARMQRLQPKIQQLQQRYKRDREILQKKMMELYRKEGVNPLSGCLPMLIQFPILYVLWRAILYSAERIHLSPGFLWMSDLSVADPYYIIVILNVIAMILQSKLSTPTTTSGGQRPNWALVYGMPLFMGFLLRNFPAGMWLYWFFTTIFQVGQQWLINLEIGRLEPAAPAPEVGSSGSEEEGKDEENES
ncbi:MAG: YidC/Oxa1 family membrane protein insertase [Candidatus Bipolaricaulia bacterium]